MCVFWLELPYTAIKAVLLRYNLSSKHLNDAARLAQTSI